MGLFYKVSDQKLLIDRNELFIDVGIPALKERGFLRSPFRGAWHGEFDSNNKAYFQQFCRISKKGFIEVLDVSIIKGDERINIYLAVFDIRPKISSLDELKANDGLSFSMTVKNKSKFMKLRSDDYKGPPLFYMLFLPQHKVSGFISKSGYEDSLNKLKHLIKSDMENIDDFVKRWHELHMPNLVEWPKG